MKISRVLLFVVAIMILLSACKKQDNTSPYHVYVSGTRDFAFQNTWIYLKDGQPIVFPDGVDGGKMVVDHGNIYAPCYGGYTKNGMFVTIPGAKQVTSIAVHGEDIYAVGASAGINNKCFYWKNDDMIILSDSSAETMELDYVAVSGEDVYFVGFMGSQAGYWKNGLFCPIQKSNLVPQGIRFSGQDVYIWGKDDNNYIGYWKNQEFHALAQKGADYPEMIRDLVVCNNDVYAITDPSVSRIGTALYWKNDQPMGPYLPEDVILSSIAVKGNKVYVIGNEPNATGKYDGVIWENGKKSVLASNFTAAIVVVE